jgi:hypothetical protein
MLNYRVYTTLLLVLSFSRMASQTYFYHETSQKDTIKIESLRGLELNSCNTIFTMPSYTFQLFPSFGMSSLFREHKLMLNYFHEKALAKRITIIGRGGIGLGINPIFKLTYPGAQVGIEPRLYLSLSGRRHLNTGWHIGLPTNIGINVLIDDHISPKTTYTSLWLSTAPTLGYRGALSKNIFLEGGLGWNIDLLFSGLIKQLYAPPYFNIKLGYALN